MLKAIWWDSTVGCIVTLTLSLLAAPLTAAAPPGKMPRIGVLEFGSPPASPDWKAGSLFLQELHKHGWLEGWIGIPNAILSSWRVTKRRTALVPFAIRPSRAIWLDDTTV
jgi:hypothetical protein